jgi:hypothetical protein
LEPAPSRRWPNPEWRQRGSRRGDCSERRLAPRPEGQRQRCG